MGHFKVERIESGLRFTAADGWVDIQLHGDGRGSLRCGTYNGAVPEVFGDRVWHLLRETMPELGLTVLAAELEPNQHLERVLVGAGFTKDGHRRRWSETGKDLLCYSILDSEVKHEAAEPEGEPLEPISAE